MNTNLTQDDDSIEFKKAVKSPYKCPFRLMISDDYLFLSSLREAEDDHETFLVISELDENNQIVMSSNFVKVFLILTQNRESDTLSPKLTIQKW